MADLHVYTNHTEWAAGSSIDDAILSLREDNGCPEDEYVRDEWEQLPDDQNLTIAEEDGFKITHTCSEWCTQEGRGFLASTEV